ncbi:phage head morphogenesis protein [Synechococcales cyanobacterium C]|uniref:Phage head morphogenesis protein n=1 Tax=Petrachloros mirabilis ULC683 TaxID=2781853 RepID=A0A8K1ZWZ5_9CYAN|nr:phage minor head protein [Petrachloros mirabilis]NCJ05197.1 phage head morphogenesis protein [Petrachloros mirabilis ULC683]
MAIAPLKFLISLPPRLAIAWFRRKGHQITWDWEEMLEESHNRAFTVAKAAKLDILQSIRDAFTQALEEGQTERSFRQNLEPILKQKGWWGRQTVEGPDGEEEVQLGSPYRLRTIYRTNLQTAMMAGRHAELAENVDDRPYWQYVAVLDARTRPTHRQLDGLIFRHDDPFWNSFYPPNGFNCRCRIRALSQRDIDRRGLVVGSSEGLLTQDTALLSQRSGLTVPTAVYRGAEGAVRPDPGWSYSVAQGQQEPDLRRLDPDLAQQYREDEGDG